MLPGNPIINQGQIINHTPNYPLHKRQEKEAKALIKKAGPNQKVEYVTIGYYNNEPRSNYVRRHY